MQLIVLDDYEQLSAAAADWVVAQITAKPDAAAVFPTGNSPLGLYRELTGRHQRGEFDASRLRIFLLDEYVGLTPDDPRTLYGWLEKALLMPLAISPRQVHRLPSGKIDAAVCQAYDNAIRAAGGLDFAVLGLGPNGHLGYNDPPAAGDAPTRVLTLTDSSLDGAAGYFGGRERVPRQAVTLGMQPLLAARQILLIVSGAQKREILRQALKGPVTPAVPASYLQETANVTVLADRAAWPEG
ncbi:MAG TPA: glucosamine-6-phosphate deaminase [Caldilineaceae bacterium]|nr:glucosamine-6-phosphate deaminase [Caldilineaceae bacterium]